MSLTTRKMSDRHEEHLAERLGGDRTRNSGAVWSDPADGHQMASEGHWRFTWDGKSTLGKSIGVTREMWEKLTKQARGLEPLLPLRWYATDRLDVVALDLVALDLETFAQMQEDANTYRAIKEAGCCGGVHDTYGAPGNTCRACGLASYEQGEALHDD